MWFERAFRPFKINFSHISVTDINKAEQVSCDKTKSHKAPPNPHTTVVVRRSFVAYIFIATDLSALHLSANAVHAVLVLWPHIAAWLLLDYHRSALHLASTKAPRQIPDPW